MTMQLNSRERLLVQSSHQRTQARRVESLLDPMPVAERLTILTGAALS
jgi:hypothetical protein